MRLPSPLPALLAVATSLISPASIQAATVAPLDFREVEYLHTGDAALAAGRTAILAAVAIGSPLPDAIQILRAAGATCRPDRHHPEAIKCLYRQMWTDGDATDEVRWTTSLNSESGRVTDVHVDREVDSRVIS